MPESQPQQQRVPSAEEIQPIFKKWDLNTQMQLLNAFQPQLGRYKS